MDGNQRYQEYLESDKWIELRRLARDRADNQCEFCGGSPDHVHHVRYPKRYAEDHIDNLVVACEKCYRKMHGIREETLYRDEWIATIVGVFFHKDTVLFRVELDPMPTELQMPETLNSLRNKETRTTDWIDELPGKLDGLILTQGQPYKLLLPITSNFIQEVISNISLETFFLRAWEKAVEAEDNIGVENVFKQIDDSHTVIKTLFKAFEAGPHSFACKVPETK